MQGLLERMRPYAAQLIAERRMLHAHPELSGQETRTMEMIAAALRELGLRVQVIPQGGVIGVLDGREDGACVLLRADCDVLPIQESPSNLSQPRTCVSQNPAVMHACGHDAHMAMLLCAARTLAAMRDELAGVATARGPIWRPARSTASVRCTSSSARCGCAPPRRIRC